MSKPYTLASYKVIAGKEDEFIDAFTAVSEKLVALPHPPFWATLIRSTDDPSRFYTFANWEKPEDVLSLRDSTAFQDIGKLCEEMTTGNFELVLHKNVRE